jgi:Ser/Thr protein kinase RdoA (MazF antagonist)
MDASDQNQNRSGRNSEADRTKLEGKTAYVKRYSAGGWGKDEPSTRARLEREADMILRMEQPGLFPPRLGTLRLLAVDPKRLQIVTEEVPGEPLDRWLTDPYRRAIGRDCLRALSLAGRWLRRFQALAATDADAAPVSSIEPHDLHEYCRLRLDAIAELGYVWEDKRFRGRLDETLTRLLAQVPMEDQRSVLGHGDFHAGNMIWDGAKLTVIDFGMVSLKPPLADAASFLHRLELMRVYRPWKRWPLALWKRAFLRGYGRRDAERSPAFMAQMIRLWVCRLHSFVARPTPTIKDRVHNAWVRRCARDRLMAAVAGE